MLFTYICAGNGTGLYFNSQGLKHEMFVGLVLAFLNQLLEEDSGLAFKREDLNELHDMTEWESDIVGYCSDYGRSDFNKCAYDRLMNCKDAFRL